jgi:hypothetical protein
MAVIQFVFADYLDQSIRLHAAIKQKGDRDPAFGGSSVIRQRF